MVSKQPKKKRYTKAESEQRTRKYLETPGRVYRPIAGSSVVSRVHDPRPGKQIKRSKDQTTGSYKYRNPGIPERKVIRKQQVAKREKMLIAPVSKRATDVLMKQTQRAQPPLGPVRSNPRPSGRSAEQEELKKRFGQRGRLKVMSEVYGKHSEDFSRRGSERTSPAGWRKADKIYAAKAAPELQTERKRKVQARATNPRTQFRKTEAKKYGTKKR